VSGTRVGETGDVEVSRLVHHVPAALLSAAAVALLVVLPERLGDGGRFVAVALLQVLFVVAWVAATGIRTVTGSLVLGAAAAVAADLALVQPERPSLGGLLAVLGLALPAAMLHQMVRRPREALVASLAGSVTMLAVVCALAVLLREIGGDDGARLAVSALLAVGAALVAGHLVDLVLPRPQVAFGVPRGLLALVLGVVAAAAVTWFRRSPDDLYGAISAAIFGGIVGAVAVLVSLAASYVVVEADRATGGRSNPWALPVVQAVLPVAACAPIALALAYQTTL
jgi:hypothetical protein